MLPMQTNNTETRFAGRRAVFADFAVFAGVTA
jgi:hypothetical protein